MRGKRKVARFLPRYGATVLFVLFLGCGDAALEPSGVCPSIGCNSGITLLFDRVPEDGTVIIVEGTLGRKLPWPPLVCGVNVDCSRPIVLPDFKPSKIIIEVRAPNGAATLTTVFPVYDPGKYPCAGCFKAEVQVKVP